jgi:hypothetical protein
MVEKRWSNARFVVLPIRTHTTEGTPSLLRARIVTKVFILGDQYGADLDGTLPNFPVLSGQ